MTPKTEKRIDKFNIPENLIPICDYDSQRYFIKGILIGAEFAEWVSDNGWILCIDKTQWSNYEKSDIGEFATTPELLDIFITEKMKENESSSL